MVPFNHSPKSHIQLVAAGVVCSGLKSMATFRFYELSSEMLRSGIRMLCMSALAYVESASEEKGAISYVSWLLSSCSYVP